MAWFTPAELPENRYYLFGKGVHGRWPNDAAWISWAKSPSSNPSWRGDAGTPGSTIDARVEETYRTIARKIVENVMKTCS